MIEDLTDKLEQLRAMDVSNLPPVKKAEHLARIQELEESLERRSSNQPVKRSLSIVIGEKNAKPRTVFKLDDEVRLVFAMTKLDYLFSQHLNGAGDEWKIIAKHFNDTEGFSFGDFQCGPVLDPIDPESLQRKWEKLSKDFRTICLAKQSISTEIRKRTYTGEFRQQDQDSIRRG